MQNKLIVRTFQIMIIVLILSGCSRQNHNDNATSKDVIKVFNPFESKFGTYNLKYFRPEAISNKSDNANVMQYAFHTGSTLYTSGDSIRNHFEIVNLENGSVKTVVKLKNQMTDAVFPLATDGSNTFFFIADCSAPGLPLSRVARFEKGRLVEFSKTKGHITDGALLNGQLYFTSYDENSQNYTLYSLDYSSYNSNPVIVKKGLALGQIYVLNKKLYMSDKTRIYNSEDQFENKSENFYDTASNTLIQLGASSEGGSLLSLVVIKCDTKKIVGSANGVVGMSIQNGEVTAYCYGGVKTIPLSSSK